MPNVGPMEIIVVLMFLLIPYAIAKLASGKGYSFAAYFVFGLFVWPIALLVTALLPDKRDAQLPSPSATE